MHWLVRIIDRLSAQTIPAKATEGMAFGAFDMCWADSFYEPNYRRGYWERNANLRDRWVAYINAALAAGRKEGEK